MEEDAVAVSQIKVETSGAEVCRYTLPALHYRARGMLASTEDVDVVVSRVNRNSRESQQNNAGDRFQISRLQKYGVSRALWPVNVHRCIATDKVAQGRRFMIMKGIWWCCSSSRVDFKHILLRHFQLCYDNTIYFYLFYTAITISFLSVGILLILFAFYPWPIVLLFVILRTVSIVIAIHLWLCCIGSDLQKQPEPMPHIAVRAHPEQTNPYFPVTTMPTTPLIRVLDTIDLSSANVEHFLETSASTEQNLPRSQLAMPIDELIRLPIDE
jgi:hypothetical protein